MELKHVNIGAEIESRINQLGVSKSEFGRKIGIPQQNVNRILSKPSIDTDKLSKICSVLDYNFFCLYCAQQSEHYEAHGSHGISAKNIGSIDNREIVEVSKGNAITEVGEVSEAVILPPDCPEEAKIAVERLTLEVKLLKQLLEEKERFIGYLIEKK